MDDRSRTWLWFGIVTLIAAAHAVVAVLSMGEKSGTSDELAHITGGYTFNRFNDYRMQPENGLLPQRLHAVLLGDVKYPDFDRPDWQTSEVWVTGYAFMYRSGNDADSMLRKARSMNALFGFGTLLLVAWWARRLFGDVGGIVAASFGAACPTMLAHSPLATSDMAMTFFFLATMTAYWSHLHRPGASQWWLSALVFSLACIAKFTAVLLLPLTIALAIARALNPAALRIFGINAERGISKFGLIALSTFGHAAVAIAVIWIAFGMRYSAFNPDLPGGQLAMSWEQVMSFGGLPAKVIDFCRSLHLLPEGYLFGLSFVLYFAKQRGAFLDGEYSIHGWPEFFPLSFLYKTPPTLILALGAAMLVGLLWARRAGWKSARHKSYAATPLIVFFGVYWAFSIQSELNIGHRHILPTYPMIYIAVGLLGWAVQHAARKSRGARVAAAIALIALGGAHLLTAARIHPHHLAYFSPVVGGPGEGYKHLVDSSLDWGQDLPGLKAWMDRNVGENDNFYFSYFGTSDPAYYGIRAIMMPRLHHFFEPRRRYAMEPGIYAISASMLQHVYMGIRGPWTLENERRYTQLRLNEENFLKLAEDPTAHPELLKDLSLEDWATGWAAYEQLRFARLCHYLRARTPDDHVGYSILIFRVTQTELDTVLHGSIQDFTQAIETAALKGRID